MDEAAVGIAGIVGTLLGTLVGPLVTARRNDAAWLRQQRIALYIDALSHAHDLQLIYDEQWWAGMPPGGRPQLRPQDEVTARVVLLAPARVDAAWRELVRAERNLDAWTSLTYSGDPKEQPPADQTRALLAAVRRLQEHCHADATAGGARRLFHREAPPRP